MVSVKYFVSHCLWFRWLLERQIHYILRNHVKYINSHGSVYVGQWCNSSSPTVFVNPGRALEDLRSSLFNVFRSPEGAKRQQQQLCGPATALTFNFIVAVGIIFMNKLVRMLNFLPCLMYIFAWLDLTIAAFQLVTCLVCLTSGAQSCWVPVSYISHFYPLCRKLVIDGHSKIFVYPPCISLKISSLIYVIYSWFCYGSIYWPC